MSCRQSKKQIRSNSPAYPVAVATWKSTRPLTPASRARSRHVAIDGAWKSNPVKTESGYAEAIVTTDAPCPHPTSATRAPALSRASTPSSAGIHAVVRWARYPVRKNHSVPQKRQGWWSPQLSAPSPRNASAIMAMSWNIEANVFMPRATKTGESSSARAIATSGPSS